MMRMVFRAPAAALFAAISLAACKPSMKGADSAEAGELARLRSEVARLREENAQLRLSPAVLALEVDNAIRASNEEKALAAYKELADTFPVAAETSEMHKRLETFLVRHRAQEEEERRIASQGLKALPVTAAIVQGDTQLTVTSLNVAKRWIFDSWGDGWRFVDAEKDKKILVARMNISSKAKDPSLFGLAAYVADGQTLKRIGQMRYRFARWSSYGSFLGTQADYRNEFSHAWKIPFTAGISISDEDLKKRPIFLVASSEGCNQRNYERFGQPPVFYTPQECKSLKPTLTPGDFKAGSLAVLKRLD